MKIAICDDEKIETTLLIWADMNQRLQAVLRNHRQRPERKAVVLFAY